MLLAIDLGNTRTKIGLFEEDELIEVAFLTEDWTLSDLPEKAQQADQVMLSATGRLEESLEAQLAEDRQYLKLNNQTTLPFKNTYETPETLGRDRIAGVAGAQALYPHENVLVVDAGTCITYDVISRQNTYLGGAIAPGIQMRLRAMHAFTARLPLVEQQAPKSLIGKSTEEALRAGGQLAAVYEMRECIRQLGQQFPGMRVLLTGGDAPYFSQNLRLQAWVQPHLVLYGLQKIFRYHALNP